MGVKLVTPSNVTEKDVEIELRLEPDSLENDTLVVRAYKDGEWIPAPHICGFTVIDGKIQMETYAYVNKDYFHVEGSGHIDVRQTR